MKMKYNIRTYKTGLGLNHIIAILSKKILKKKI